MTKKYVIIKSGSLDDIYISAYKYNLWFRIFGPSKYGYVVRRWLFEKTEEVAIKECKKELVNKLKPFTYEIIEIIEV